MDVAFYLVFYAVHHSAAYSRGGIRTEVRSVPSTLHKRKTGRKVVQRLQAHGRSWRNVSTQILANRVYEVESDARADVDDKDVPAGLEPIDTDNSGKTV